MIPNKNGIGIVFVGWALIVGTLCNIFFGFEIVKDRSPIIFLYNMIGYIAVFPRGLSWVSAILFQDIPFLIRTNILFWMVITWELLIVIAGVGILRLNNLLRLVLIILCSIQIATYAFGRLFLLITVSIHRSSATFLYAFPEIILALIFPIAYIFYFTRQSIKSLFKNNT